MRSPLGKLHDVSRVELGQTLEQQEPLVALPHTSEAAQRTELEGYDGIQGGCLVGHALGLLL